MEGKEEVVLMLMIIYKYGSLVWWEKFYLQIVKINWVDNLVLKNIKETLLKFQ